MAKTTSRVADIARRYIRLLETYGVTVSGAYLFGSHVEGTPREDSDVDLLIVSPAFSGMPYAERWKILGDVLAQLREPIDVLAYSPEEFESRRCNRASFVSYILNHSERVDLSP